MQITLNDLGKTGATTKQAFPAKKRLSGGKPVYFPGMTQREWFAGQALAGLMARSDLNQPISVIVAAAFAAADEMLLRQVNGS